MGCCSYTDLRVGGGSQEVISLRIIGSLALIRILVDTIS